MRQLSHYKNMNFNFKKNKISLFLFFLLQIILSPSFSQNYDSGTPFFVNISPKEYGYENQNYSVTQDNRGFMYIGNMNGVLEFDGNNWNLVKVYGNPKLDVTKKGRIYVGGYNDLGYLSYNNKGALVYISLISEINKKYLPFGDISNVCTSGERVYFSSQHYIFKLEKNIVSVIDSSISPISLFKINDNLYLHNMHKGLYAIENGEIKNLPQGDFFKEKKIVDILNYEGKLMIRIQNDRNFWIYSGYSLTPIITPIDDFLEKNFYSTGCNLPDQSFAFGTKRMGVIVVDKNFRVITSLNKKQGLLDDEVTDIFLDRSNHIWLTLYNGISFLEMPSAFTFYGINLGLKGNTKAICRYGNYLYIATSQGVFYLNHASYATTENIEQVSGLHAGSYRFFQVMGKLLVSTSDGVFSIVGSNSHLISKPIIETMYSSKLNPAIVYIGRTNGLTALYHIKGSWRDLGQLKNTNKRIRTIAEGKDGFLWLGTDYDGVIRVDLKSGYTINAPIKEYKSNCGLPENFLWLDVYYTSNGVLFSTFKGAYRYNSKKDNFYADTLLGFDFTKENRWIYPVIEDANRNLWISSGFNDKYDKLTGMAIYKGQGKPYQLYTEPFGKINDITIESIYPEENGVIWFGSFDGLIRYDSKLFAKYNKDTSKFHTFIRQILIGKDSLVYGGGNLFNNGSVSASFNTSAILAFKYKYNKIHFEFASPAYESKDRLLFQSFLEGFEKNWSSWGENNFKEYTNLPEGEYVFRVRARNIYGKTSNEATYRFNILPPFYRKWYAWIVYLLVVTTFIVMIVKWRSFNFAKERHKLEQVIHERTEELVKQKERSEELVANILPKDTADELINKGKADSKRFEFVSVMFTDIQGFTKIAETMNPEMLVHDLDTIFLHFDSIVEKYNVEKIKTIGDAYMCAGGIPRKNKTNPVETVLAAMEMQQHLDFLHAELDSVYKQWFMRIGIHTGPVITGVVGSKKLSYDIWGDTVNIASRMESSGTPGKINISSKTFENIKDFFICETRGKLPIKYKGDIDMYFINGIKPELSIRGEGTLPNKNFLIKLQLVRYEDLEETIFAKLEKGLPKNLYYHNFKHTIDVTAQVEILGRYENITEEEMLLIKTASLLHDCGFLIGYDDHELLGIKQARETLPEYKYTPDQINTICELIFATKFPPQPKTLLEQILCDADLDYLGRNDFIPNSQNLFRELYEKNKIKNMEDWNKLQIKFIEGHQYFTESARKLRDVNKSKQLDELRKMI